MRRFLIPMAVMLVPTLASAASLRDVVINEVAWAGSMAAGTGDQDEWIELYNNTSSNIDLTGWIIDDDAGAATYALSGAIPAHGTFLIERRESATDVQSDLVVATMSLGNTGDALELKDDQGNSIDLLATAAGWYAGVNNGAVLQDVSMERKSPTAPGDLGSNWGNNDGVTVNGSDSGGNPLQATPKAQNSIFGTFVPGPEIVHIHNLGIDAVDVTFSEAVLAATAGAAANYSFNSNITPGAATPDTVDQTLVHLTGISGLTAGDAVVLDINGVENLNGDPCATSALLVAGVLDIGAARADLNADTVPDLLATAPDAFLTVRGVVSSVADLDHRDIRIQDLTGGIQVWDTNQVVAPLLLRGDEIRVSGKLSQYSGLDQIVSIRAVVLSGGNSFAPEVLSVQSLLADPETYESLLVQVLSVSKIQGTWPAVDQAANIDISDDGGTSVVTLRIDEQTDIDGSTEPLYPINLTGIFGQFDSSAPYDGNYQILPRSLADIAGAGPGCIDLDQDGYGAYCTAGLDCDDADPATHPGAAEICDTVDNNCDNQTDEAFADLGTPCDGPDDDSCADGTWECNQAGDDTICNESGIGIPEFCNGEDDDCDGTTDEDWPDLGKPCDSDPPDGCLAGQWVCNDLHNGLVCTDTGTSAETCNGVDDDCDEATDEDWPDRGNPCDGDDDDQCAEGTFICNQDEDGVICDEAGGTGREEECNGEDDDCDGATDEDLGSYSCNQGVCREEIPKCQDGTPAQCPDPTPPVTTESQNLCRDGLDNDCDGFADSEDTDCKTTGGGDGCGCGTQEAGSSLFLLVLLGLALLRVTLRK